jgi:outer membrane protein assembly factor BamB
VALDPATGAELARFDPPGPGGLTAPTLGDDETVYVGTHGRLSDRTAGHVYALRREGDHFEVRGDFPVEGMIDWSPPVIGAGGGLFFGTSDFFSTAALQVPYAPGAPTPDLNPRFYGVFE